MLYLFTGEEFLLHQELQRRKAGFSKKFGEGTIAEYKPDQNRNWKQIAQDLRGYDLFITKKMIIIWGIPEDTTATNKLKKEDLDQAEHMFETHYTKIFEDHIVILASYKPDKRKKGYKFLQKITESKEFVPYKDQDLSLFVQKQCTCSPEIAQTIITTIGTDMGRLRNECEKVRLRQEEKPGEKNIERILATTQESNAFGMIDTLRTDKKKTILALDILKENGENRNAVLGIFLWAGKTTMQYLQCLTVGIEGTGEIAKKIGIHPFVASKIAQQKKTLQANEENIKIFFYRLLEVDFAIKTGRISDSLFRLEMKKYIWEL